MLKFHSKTAEEAGMHAKTFSRAWIRPDEQYGAIYFLKQVSNFFGCLGECCDAVSL